MRFNNGLMVQAAICFMTSGDGESSAGSSTTSATEAAASLGEEIVSDAEAFISNVETTVVEDAEAAYTWLKAEYAKLEPAVLADLKAAIALAVTAATAGESSGSVVADVLTALYADGAAVLNSVSSDVVSATVGLTTVKAPPAS